MTTDRMVQFHEFKFFRTSEGDANLWAALCWCGWLSNIYCCRKEAKSAHIRHQVQQRRYDEAPPP